MRGWKPFWSERDARPKEVPEQAAEQVSASVASLATAGDLLAARLPLLICSGSPSRERRALRLSRSCQLLPRHPMLRSLLAATLLCSATALASITVSCSPSQLQLALAHPPTFDAQDDSRLSTDSLPIYHRLISLAPGVAVPTWELRGLLHVDAVQDEAWLEETGKGVEQLKSPAWEQGTEGEERYQISVGEQGEGERRQVIAVDSVSSLAHSFVTSAHGANSLANTLVHPLSPPYATFHRAPLARVHLPTGQESNHGLALLDQWSPPRLCTRGR